MDEMQNETELIEENIQTDNTPKETFCKKCGGKINDDKKCTKCGKQYFKITINFIIALCLSLIIVVLGTLFGFQIKKSLDLENKIQKISKEKDTLSAQVAEYKDKYYDELFDRIDKESFMDNYVVIVCNDGTKKYHKYGCEDLNLSSFWVYNTDAAVGDGYIMCKKCN